jgi:ArsR family transcriptional regulator, arsenate/arsenite/antimonite-responsive transcriptional repressor
VTTPAPTTTSAASTRASATHGSAARVAAPVTAVNSTVASGCCRPLSSEALDEEAADVLARQFAALSDPARLRLLSLVATAPGGEVCACDLVTPLGKSQPTVSHHLKVLREAGLVVADKRGTWMWYRVDRDRLAALRDTLG